MTRTAWYDAYFTSQLVSLRVATTMFLEIECGLPPAKTVHATAVMVRLHFWTVGECVRANRSARAAARKQTAAHSHLIRKPIQPTSHCRVLVAGRVFVGVAHAIALSTRTTADRKE